MTTMMRGMRTAAVLAATLAATGCSQLGPLGEVLGGVISPNSGAGGNQVAGEIRYVDTQRQQIQIETTSGQTGNVYFDQRTRVVYQNQEYPVTSLERGDQVQLRVQQDNRGTVYTDYIYVTRSVQDAGGYGGGTGGVYDQGQGVQRLEGNVGWIDANRGQFELRTSRGSAVVSLRYNTAGYDADRFRRLRQGEFVRVEGRWASQDRFELDRFL